MLSNRIYIVETRGELMKSLASTLSKNDFKLIGSTIDSQQAIQEIIKIKPDLVLVNTKQGKMSIGQDLINDIFWTYPVPIMLYTDADESINMDQYLVKGVYGVVSKSMTGSELKFNIEFALKRFSEDQKNKHQTYFLNQVQRLASIGHWKLDLKSNVLEWSDETYRIFGLKKGEIEASYEGFLGAIHPQDRDLVNVAYEASLKNKSPYGIEHRLLVNNEVKYVIENGESFYDENNEPYLSIGTVQDITERKKAELRIQRSEESFREVFENSVNESYLVSPIDLSIVDINKTALKKLKYGKEEIIGKSIETITYDYGGNQEEFFPALRGVLVGEEIEGEGYHTTKNNVEYPVRFNVKKIIVGNEEIILLSAINNSAEVNLRNSKQLELKTHVIINRLLSVSISANSIEDFLDEALEVLLDLPFLGNAQKGMIYLKNDEGNLEMFATKNIASDKIANCRLITKDGNCACHKLLQTKKSQFVCCEVNKDNFPDYYDSLANYNIVIDHDDEMIGSLCLYSNLNEIGLENIELLNIIGSSLGLMIVRYRDRLKLEQSEDKFRTYVEHSADVISIIDDHYNVEYNSPNNEFVFGYGPEENVGISSIEMLHPADQPKLKAVFDVLETYPDEIMTVEFRFKHKNGNWVWIESNLRNVVKKGEKPYFIVNSRDNTQRKTIVLIPAENPNPLLRVDYDLNVIYANESALALGDDMINDNRLVPKRAITFLKKFIKSPALKREIKIRIHDKHYLIYAVNIKEEQYVNLYGSDITSLEESKAAHMQLSLDLEKLVDLQNQELVEAVSELNKEIAVREEAQEKLQKSLDEKEVLLNEITHRVKNNLQVISSLLSLQRNRITNPESLDLLSKTGHRIKSMALIHETLYRSSDFSQINFKFYTDSLERYVVNSFDVKHLDIEMDIADVELTIDTATSCGMIVMELITNAVKYAFPNNRQGSIQIRLEELPEDKFLLEISDNGVGLPEGFDLRKSDSLGMQLVYGLASQLSGKAEMISDNGLTAKIQFKDTKRHKYE